MQVPKSPVEKGSPPQKDTYQISIKSRQQGRKIPYSAGDTLLECLEINQIEVQYHCREGFCGACRTKLLSGKIEYNIAPLAYLDDDEFLPCCSVPKTDIEIELD